MIYWIEFLSDNLIKKWIELEPREFHNREKAESGITDQEIRDILSHLSSGYDDITRSWLDFHY